MSDEITELHVVKMIREELERELRTLRGGDQLSRQLAQAGMRLLGILEATLDEASRLRDLRDALIDSMERQGGIPMTDALADALVLAGVDIYGKREVEPDMVTVPKVEWEATKAMAEAFVTEPDRQGTREEWEAWNVLLEFRPIYERVRAASPAKDGGAE